MTLPVLHYRVLPIFVSVALPFSCERHSCEELPAIPLRLEKNTKIFSIILQLRCGGWTFGCGDHRLVVNGFDVQRTE